MKSIILLILCFFTALYAIGFDSDIAGFMAVIMAVLAGSYIITEHLDKLKK